MYRNVVTQMSPDRNGQTEKSCSASNEFSWMSIWPLVKPHTDYSVDILEALWLRPTFGESCRLLSVNKGKDFVVDRVW